MTGQLIYRGIQGESDYPLLFDINRSSRQADNDPYPITLEELIQAFSPSQDFNPARDVILASLQSAPGDPIGYTRLGWYSSRPDTRLYYQHTRLKKDFRGGSCWQEIVLEGERRMRAIAAHHPPVLNRFFQGWASQNQLEWISVLESTGYQVVRRFNNMLYSLGDIPDIPLPAGFTIRPVKPKHMRLIWEAQKEFNAGLFENVAEDWLDEKFPVWSENPEHTPALWQVAWEGEQIAGMVLPRIEDDPRGDLNHKHGFTEHIYVRPAYRGRGLASALIARSLQVLKNQGVQTVELGVDSENESRAFELYLKLGYRTYSIDTWYRKPFELN